MDKCKMKGIELLSFSKNLKGKRQFLEKHSDSETLY